MQVSTVQGHGAARTPQSAPVPAGGGPHATAAPPEHANAAKARAHAARLILGGGDPAGVPEFKRYTLSIHMVEDTNRIVVQVIDPETQQVVRTVPPEHVIAALRDAQPGALVDEQA